MHYLSTNSTALRTRVFILSAVCLIASLGVALLFKNLSPVSAQPEFEQSGLSSAQAVAGLSLGWLSPNVRDSNDAMFGDIDGDGDLDVAVANEGSENQLYINQVGAAGGKLEDFEIIPLPGGVTTTKALALGDVDGDGDLDLALANGNLFNPEANQLLINQGGAQGSVTGQFIAQDLPGSSAFSRDAAFADTDGDGDLDLIVTVYAPFPTLAPNKLYTNQGGAQGGTPGVFAAPEGLPGLATPGDKSSRGLAVGDVDGDDDLDLVISGEGWPGNSNRLYTNQGGSQGGPEGAFVVTELPGDQRYGDDVAMGDIDNDGDLDIVIGTDQASWSPSQLYVNQGGTQGGVQGSFVVQDMPGGLVAACSVAMGDVESDGDLDIVLGNCDPNNSFMNFLFLNQGGAQNGVLGQFSLNALPGDPMVTRSLVFGDIDNDGDLDLFAANATTNQLYLNQGGQIFGSYENLAPTYFAARASAWGDVDGDGDLDLALGRDQAWLSDQVYVNQGGQQGGSFGSFSPYTPENSTGWGTTYDLAFGDLDNDGDLDLVAARVPWWDSATYECLDFENKLYLNQGGTQGGSKGDFIASNLPGGERVTSSIAVGDVDHDGDLDMVAGNIATINPHKDDPGSDYFTGTTQLYINLGGLQGGSVGTFSVQDLSNDDGFTSSVAFGDVDGDGDLDIAVGRGYAGSPVPNYVNSGGPGVNLLYINQGGFQEGTAGTFVSQELPGGSNYTTSLKFGDFDGDGDLDLIGVTLAAAGYSGVDQLYTNQGGLQGGTPGEFTISALDFHTSNTLALAIGDVDGDMDLDLVSATSSKPSLYVNQGGAQGGSAGEFASYDLPSFSSPPYNISLADADSDGDLDLFTGAGEDASRIYWNQATLRLALPETPPLVQVFHPLYIGSADGYAVPEIITSTTIDIPFRIADPQGSPVGSVRGFYSLNGGGVWREAVAVSGSITSNLAAPAAGANYVFSWDTFASGFFGQSDQVVFRIEAYPTTLRQGFTPPGAYTYLRSAPAPIQFANNGANVYPFRVRGTQVRVLRPGGAGLVPAQGALVMRKSPDELVGVAMGSSGVPYLTDQDGYLIGSGAISLQDTLVALWPAEITQRYTLYLTNASPTPTGLQADIVSDPGQQILQVSEQHPIYAFNLDISLEWDARNDGIFLLSLQEAIRQAASVLFDISDGQIAIGNVNIYQNRENWLASDIVIYAQTGIRPRASMGGVVETLTDDLYWDGSTIHNAYGPGQIRMGPNWDPFGASISELTVDWQRALAHELSHYLLFLPDNYLGKGASGAPISTDCRGSFMTNTYDDDYSEFLTRPEWLGDCTQTIAEYTTGRVDWETVQNFYTSLMIPTGDNPGPAVLPLDITKISQVGPIDAPVTMPPRFFDVRHAVSGLLKTVPHAQAFVFQDHGTVDLSDDQVLSMGSTLGDGDRVRLRGAAPGDRLCVFGPPDPVSGQLYAGCVESLTLLNTAIPVSPVSDWQPNIIARSITSTTLQVTVTLAVPTDTLHVQFFPAYGDPGAVPEATTSPTAPMTAVDGGALHTHTFTLSTPVFEGWLRVWVPGAQPVREAMSQLFLSPPWGPNSSNFDGGANTRSWGANTRQLGAPVASGDGQVSIFNFTDIFAETGTVSLQSVNNIPSLPVWLTQVGQAYRFSADERFPRAIAFDYLQKEVPPGYEYTLNIYYSPDEGLTWERLETQLETQYNRATAIMPDNAANSQGIYALVATVEMPALDQGWNLFAYSIPVSRTLPLALASIQDKYTSVYFYLDGNWTLFDATVLRDHPDFSALVNDLTQFDPNRAYWIYATQPVTPYLGVPAESSAALAPALSLPPATFYGWVTPYQGFVPQAGMTVEAWIDGFLCGTGTVQSWLDKLAYKLQVLADNGNNCGITGRRIEFRVGGVSLPLNYSAWDNSQAWFRPLGPPDARLFLPLLRRP